MSLFMLRYGKFVDHQVWLFDKDLSVEIFQKLE